MHILADENCGIRLVARLEQRPGTQDDAILAVAAEQHRILLTADLDFGMMAERLGRYPPVIVLMRLDPLRAHLRAEVVERFFERLQSDWRGKFFVVEPGLVRERFMKREAP